MDDGTFDRIYAGVSITITAILLPITIYCAWCLHTQYDTVLSLITIGIAIVPVWIIASLIVNGIWFLLFLLLIIVIDKDFRQDFTGDNLTID